MRSIFTSLAFSLALSHLALSHLVLSHSALAGNIVVDDDATTSNTATSNTITGSTTTGNTTGNTITGDTTTGNTTTGDATTDNTITGDTTTGSTTTSSTISYDVAIGDAAAGEALSATCVACHGLDGNSTAPAFPKIAGQFPAYAAKQLKLFQDPDNLLRNNAVMMGMVGGLSQQDILDLATFYASQSATANAINADQESAALAGQVIYRAGVAEFSITACTACHGPAGAGFAPNFPSLAGQHADYIAMQLQAFKSGERQAPMMNSIAFPLSNEQIDQLAVYISSMRQ